MAGTEFALYATPVSVYSCKVRLALALKGLTWTEIAPPGGYGSADYRTIVPQGTVPALVHGDFVLAESDAIIEYLDDIGAGPKLLPAEPRARARARAISRLIDTRLEPGLRALFPQVGTGNLVTDGTRTALCGHIDALSRLAGPGPFLNGAAPGLPDCALWPVALLQSMLERTLKLSLPSPALAEAGHAVPAAAPYLAAYRQALSDWARSRGAFA
jgi:glutathione S-transferase